MTSDQQPLVVAAPESPPAWHLRELRKYANTTYRHVPWHAEPWAQRHYSHFPHISRIDNVLIAYTPNPDKGDRDLQTPIKPGAYLRKFFSDILTIDEINRWASAVTLPNYKLNFTTDAAIIADIYHQCARACMSHTNSTYSATVGVHPTEVYANGPLALAYLTNHHGAPVARAMCWPEKHIHTRIYGESARMTIALTNANYHPGVFNNLPLPVIGLGRRAEYKTLGNSVVCPFIDHLKWARLTQPTDGEAQHLILQTAALNATHSVQHGNGLASPISAAGHRPFGLRDVQLDWCFAILAETGHWPTTFPCGARTHAQPNSPPPAANDNEPNPEEPVGAIFADEGASIPPPMVMHQIEPGGRITITLSQAGSRHPDEILNERRWLAPQYFTPIIAEAAT